MEDKRMCELFIYTLNNILRICDEITSDNIVNSILSIKLKCKDMLEYYEEYKS